MKIYDSAQVSTQEGTKWTLHNTRTKDIELARNHGFHTGQGIPAVGRIAVGPAYLCEPSYVQKLK